MISFQADFFDGLSARATKVDVEADSEALSIVENGNKQTFQLAEVRIQPPLGRARRVIELPDGGRLETDDIAHLEALKPHRQSTFWRWLHQLENHLGWVFMALAMTILTGWGAIRYGVPALAERVAQATPPTMEHRLGEQVLSSMDNKYGYFNPSHLSAGRRTVLADKLKTLCIKQPDCPAYRLEFRVGGYIGANAFALPGGILIITDELIALAKNDDEIVSVLAHELGHVQKRHALRQSLQGAISGLLLIAATGDVNSLASGLPAALLQLSYSREMETEADKFALTAMQRACTPPHVFADILLRLTEEHGGKTKNREESFAIPEIISSHPDSKARVQPFLDAKLNCQKAGNPVPVQ
jgi:predicted Zn-dependent protease